MKRIYAIIFHTRRTNKIKNRMKNGRSIYYSMFCCLLTAKCFFLFFVFWIFVFLFNYVHMYYSSIKNIEYWSVVCNRFLFFFLKLNGRIGDCLMLPEATHTEIAFFFFLFNLKTNMKCIQNENDCIAISIFSFQHT